MSLRPSLAPDTPDSQTQVNPAIFPRGIVNGESALTEQFRLSQARLNLRRANSKLLHQESQPVALVMPAKRCLPSHAERILKQGN